MKRKAVAISALILLCSAFAGATDSEYMEGQLLVRFESSGYGLDSPNPAVRASARQAIVDAAGGGTIVRQYNRVTGLCLVQLPGGVCVATAVDAFNSTAGIRYAEPNYRWDLAVVPNDPRLSDLWAMRNSGQTGGTPGADIGATEAWDYDTGSSSIVVAVTDTGVDYTHEDLFGNMWHNPVEIPDNNLDDDNNGYIDDVYGYDFAGAVGGDPADGDPDPMDVDGHGTHVSGTVGAVGNNNIGVTGVCWDVSIMALKVFADDSGGAFIADLIEAIEYAVDNGARVINASWGGYGFSQAMRDAIDVAGIEGVLFVAAAGNDAISNDLLPFYPASYDLGNIISVMATGQTDRAAIYSNYGLTTVDLGAPGGDVSVGGDAGEILSCQLGGGYVYMQGTSMAAPHVSGASALLLSIDSSLSYSGVKQILLDTTDPLAALAGLCVSGGRMNLAAAAEEVAVDDDPPTPNPAQWASWGRPKATGVHTIAMEAKQAQDRSNVQYYFECVTNGDFNSTWQSSTMYVATGLTAGTEYAFRLRARDENQNMTDWSETLSATTAPGPADSYAPFPDPPLWQVEPMVLSIGPPPLIRMAARQGSDESPPLDYYFEEKNIPVINSGWQSGPFAYIWNASDPLLAVGNTYTFHFKVRDALGNETGFSEDADIALAAPPHEFHIPTPEYPTIQSAVNASHPGDVVILHPYPWQPYTYRGPGNTRVVVNNKNITIRGLDPNHPEQVVIDCEGTPEPGSTTRAFQFVTDASTLANLTIINGWVRGYTGADGGGRVADNNGQPGTDALGGAIDCANSGPTIQNCIIENCIAQGGDGGNGIDGDWGEGSGHGGNGADANVAAGGAIYCDATSSPIIEDCLIRDCCAIGGVPGNGGSGDDAADPNPGGNAGYGGDSSAYGGAIACARGSRATVTDCVIQNCVASALYFGLPGVPGAGDANMPSGSEATRGRTYAAGGGTFHGLGGGAVSITNTLVSGCQVTGDGGGIYFGSMGNASASGCAIASNSAYIYDNNSTPGQGGGLWCAGGATLSISDSSFSGNSSDGVGGAIRAGSSIGGATTVGINNSQFTDNETDSFGGAISVSNATVTVSNSTLSSNAADEGAGIDATFCQLGVNNCQITQNEANGEGGAGIFASAGNAQVINNIFQGNSAFGPAGTGGAMYFHGHDGHWSQVTNCLIIENQAVSEGAGLAGRHGALVDVNNCTFVDNVVSAGSGGAVSCAQGSNSNAAWVELYDSILWHNTAPQGSQIGVGLTGGSLFNPWALVDVYNCDVQGLDTDVFIEDPASNWVFFWGGNIDEDPCFAATNAENPLENYYLSQKAAGQLYDSNCVDGGIGDVNNLASIVGHDLTTRTDGAADTNPLDMGYHYEAAAKPRHYLLTIKVAVEQDYEPNGTLTASAGGGDPFTIVAREQPVSQAVTQGTVVQLYAKPDGGFEVREWTQADKVPNSGDPCNTVTMDSHKTVTVSFEPVGYFFLTTEVTTDNGHINYIDENGNVVPHPGRTMHQTGEVVTLIAEPDNMSHVTHWTGTDNDLTVARENTVTMDRHRHVQAEFVAPRILYVPGEYTNIQTAIDDAQPGDIVSIAPGDYSADDLSYVISGKPITLTSTDPEDPCVVASTLVHSRIQILNVDRTCVIDGLTFSDVYWFGLDGDDGGTDENPLADGENGVPVPGGALLLHERFWDLRYPPSGSSPDVRNCVFRNRSVTGGNGGNGAVVDELPGDGGWGGWAHGGAVSLGTDSNPKFTNCQFIDCNATGGDGGNGSSGPDGRGGLWDQTVLGTWGWQYGPYVEFFKYTGLGGAVYIDLNSSPEFIDCEFVNCRAHGGCSGEGGGPVNPDVHWRINRFGGAVYCADLSKPTFVRCTFTGNVADVNGPAQWHDNEDNPADAESDDIFLSYGGAVAFEDDANPTFIECTFTDNNSTVGGAIYWTWADPVIQDCNISNNTAFHGGGILCVGGTGRIDNCVFTGNQATIDGAQGGAIASLGANTEIIGTQVIGNYSETSGAGIYISNKDVDQSEVSSWNMVRLENCLVARNISGGSGAGISANWHAFPMIQNCTIADNIVLSSAGYGGGLYSSYGNYTVINDSILWGNSATNGRQIAIRPAERPAGVYVSYSDVQEGSVEVEPPYTGGGVWKDRGCSYIYPDDKGNIGDSPSHEPLFVSIPLGDYFLSQSYVDNGPLQTQTSPCVDVGSDVAGEIVLRNGLAMSNYTTRTDLVFDRGKVDMGFHYPVVSREHECKVCDVASNGSIDIFDLAALAANWLDVCSEGNGWCNGADFNFDEETNLKDHALLASCYRVRDTEAPLPNPAEWQVRPYSISDQTPFEIAMTAVEAFDAWGRTIQYDFNCITDANFSTGWIPANSYTATGLEENTGYVFQVRARDDMGNVTRWSVQAGAITGQIVIPEDTTPPTPNPMTWAQVPYPVSANSVGMQASLATDQSGVQYGFWNLTLDPNGVSIVWQDSRTYIATDLVTDVNYTFRVAARDRSLNQNMTGWSVPASVIVQEIDIVPPLTDVHANPYKAAFAGVWPTGGQPTEERIGNIYYHTMTAAVATDGSPPVEYRFTCSDDRFSSDWLPFETYSVAVSSLQSKSYYLWQVQTRDSAVPNRNYGDPSDKWNCEGNFVPVP